MGLCIREPEERCRIAQAITGQSFLRSTGFSNATVRAELSARIAPRSSLVFHSISSIEVSTRSGSRSNASAQCSSIERRVAQ
jgi:hypothetical protein